MHYCIVFLIKAKANGTITTTKNTQTIELLSQFRKCYKFCLFFFNFHVFYLLNQKILNVC